MKKILFPIVILSVLFCSSCKTDKGTDAPKGDLITKKILYDVPIVNHRLADRSEKDPSWFWENLPYPDGDGYIDNLYEKASDGKISLYYYDMEGDYEHLEKIPKSEVKKMFEEDMTVSLPIPDIYIESTDSYMQRPNVILPLDSQHIQKLRFLEEWREVDGIIYKTVLAVAPVFVFNIDGNEVQEGYEYSTVKFWIMANDKLVK